MSDKYELVLLDADTPVFKAAKSVQQDFIIVTRKSDGATKRYPNKTTFWGHHKKKEGGELAKNNLIRIERGLEPNKPEDYEVEECAELVPEIEDHVAAGVEQFDRFIGKIKGLNLADDYRLGIGGSGNFRYEIAQQLPYKGTRKDKPLLFLEIKEAIIKKYRSKVVVVDDEEVDDWCSIKGYENYKHFLKTGKWKYVLGFLDKDIKQVISPQFNFDDQFPEVIIPTAFDAAKCFASQCLSGDLSTDNILGLPNFTKEIQEKYSLGGTRGIGKATALKYLEGCETVKDLFERVVEAYKSYYGTEKQELVSHTGQCLMWDYLDFLQDSAQLLYLRREEGEMYHICTTLDKLGIGYA